MVELRREVLEYDINHSATEILREPLWKSFVSHPFSPHLLAAAAIITAAFITVEGNRSNSAAIEELTNIHNQKLGEINGRLVLSQQASESLAAEKRAVEAKLGETQQALKLMQPVVSTHILSPEEGVAFFGAYTLKLKSIKANEVIAEFLRDDIKTRNWDLANGNVYANVQSLGCMLSAKANEGMRTATVTTKCPPAFNANEYTFLTQH